MSIFEMFGKRTYDIKLQTGLDGSGLAFEYNADVRYRPTIVSEKFMQLKTFEEGLNFLRQEYQLVQDLEAIWNTGYTEENLPNKKHEYYVLSGLFSRALQRRELQVNNAAEKARQSSKKMEKLSGSTHNGYSTEDSIKALEYSIETMESLILLNDAIKGENFHRFVGRLTRDEEEYFNRS